MHILDSAYSSFDGREAYQTTTVAATMTKALTAKNADTPIDSLFACSGDATAASKISGNTQELAQMLEHLTKEIDNILPRKEHTTAQPSQAQRVILLTGSTGAIGSYVLDILLSEASAHHIYCFNRTADAQERQIKNNTVRDLGTNFPPDRVAFLSGDLTQSNFGLEVKLYQDLLDKVTHIVHNAWPVSFNKSLAGFAPSFEGVLALIRFAVQSKANAHIQLYSSISSVFNYADVVVPEEIIFDLSTPMGGGYGQAKYLAERLLDHACKTLGIVASVVRIGQVAGAARTSTGWNLHEWFPSLITTCAFMGVLPASLDDVDKIDWIPIDHLADVLVELLLSSADDISSAPGASVYHVVHPRPVTWTSLLPTVRKAIEGSGLSKGDVRVLRWDDFAKLWISTLMSKVSLKSDGSTRKRATPSAKHLAFYLSLEGGATRGLSLELSMRKTTKLSPKLMKLQPVQESWVRGWADEWLEAVKST